MISTDQETIEKKNVVDGVGKELLWNTEITYIINVIRDWKNKEKNLHWLRDIEKEGLLSFIYTQIYFETLVWKNDRLRSNIE